MVARILSIGPIITDCCLMFNVTVKSQFSYKTMVLCVNVSVKCTFLVTVSIPDRGVCKGLIRVCGPHCSFHLCLCTKQYV